MSINYLFTITIQLQYITYLLKTQVSALTGPLPGPSLVPVMFCAELFTVGHVSFFFFQYEA
jgi:hypothetical protein